MNSLDYYSWRLIGKLTAFLHLQEFSLWNIPVEESSLLSVCLPLADHGESRQHPSQGCSSVCQFKYRRHTYHITLAYSPISLTGVAFINFVSIFRCSSSAHNRVHTRCVDSSTLVSSLSSHRNPYIVFCL